MVGRPTHQSYDPAYFRLLFQVEDRHFWFRARNAAIAAVAKRIVAQLPAGLPVLEIGCGTGNTLRVLERACPGRTVIGMDLFLEGLRYARQRGAAPLVQGDLNAPPFGGTFGLIGLFDVLEHMPDDRRVLHNLQNLLDGAGRLLLTVPAHMSLWSYFDTASHHCRRYERTELEHKLRESGFEEEEASYLMAGLFPWMWLGRRTAARAGRPPTGNNSRATELVARELRIVPVVNEILALLLSLEARWLALGRTLPWGTSLLVVARTVTTYQAHAMDVYGHTDGNGAPRIGSTPHL